MRKLMTTATLFTSLAAPAALGLALAPEEFTASRQLACVLAEQSLGYLSEKEYGARTHTVLDDFDELERDNILSKALGYVDGLMFSVDASDAAQVDGRLEDFVQSNACRADAYYRVTVNL